MNYKIIVTDQAEEQLDNILYYILMQFNSREGAKSVLDDVLKTYEKLRYVAGSLQLCNDKYLASKGYRKIVLEKHNYVLLYQMRDDEVYVNGIFHVSENYKDKL